MGDLPDIIGQQGDIHYNSAFSFPVRCPVCLAPAVGAERTRVYYACGGGYEQVRGEHNGSLVHRAVGRCLDLWTVAERGGTVLLLAVLATVTCPASRGEIALALDERLDAYREHGSVVSDHRLGYRLTVPRVPRAVVGTYDSWIQPVRW